MRQGQLSFEDGIRARIGACRATREWAVASSYTLFKNDASPLFQMDPQSKRGPNGQVDAIFDSFDEHALKTAQHVDKMDREGAVPDGTRSEPKKN